MLHVQHVCYDTIHRWKLIRLCAVDDLNEELNRHEVDHEHPSPGCTSSGSLLFYQCRSGGSSNVKLLDCSTLPPKLSRKFRFWARRDDKKSRFIEDMCCLRVNDGLLLISATITYGDYDGSSLETTKIGGLLACSVVGEECTQLWCVEGKLTGMETGMKPKEVTTDGNGKILIIDVANKYVQMFAIDGMYEGSILRDGEHGIKRVWNIAWCKKTSSLMVVHKDDDNEHNLAQITLNI